MVIYKQNSFKVKCLYHWCYYSQFSIIQYLKTTNNFPSFINYYTMDANLFWPKNKDLSYSNCILELPTLSLERQECAMAHCFLF